MSYDEVFASTQSRDYSLPNDNIKMGEVPKIGSSSVASTSRASAS